MILQPQRVHFEGEREQAPRDVLAKQECLQLPALIADCWIADRVMQQKTLSATLSCAISGRSTCNDVV